MSCAAEHHHLSRGGRVPPVGEAGAMGSAKFLLHRLWDDIADWVAGDDEAHIRASLAQSGGRLTDSIEREMFERSAVSNWSVDA